MIGPNHTFRLRNAHTNLEVKSLFNAARLKPYYDPDDRPANPSEDLPNPEAELDPEEIDLPDEEPQNQDTNTNGPTKRSQNPANSDKIKPATEQQKLANNPKRDNSPKETKMPKEPDQKSLHNKTTKNQQVRKTSKQTIHKQDNH